MDQILWLAGGAVAIVMIVALIVWMAGRRSEAQLSAARQELQGSLATQNQAFTSQMNHVVQTLTQQLGQVRQELHNGVASTGQLAADAQREVARRLESSTEALLQIREKIGEVHQTSQDLSKAAQTLESVLGGAKTRGTLGEVALQRLLEDALPRSAYEMQYKFASTGDTVDAVVRNGERVLPIDSKFPLEAYRRLVSGDDDARRDFSQAVRKHADSIALKYILPHEHTLHYAFMFVPSESIYYELLLTEDSKHGMLDEYCRSKHVFPVSPNTFCACLGVIAVGLRGQKIEESARRLMESLGGLRKHLEDFAREYETLGAHLRNARNKYEEADDRLCRARNFVEQMAQGAIPEAEAAQKSLESAGSE